jgi:formaldehyde-activating enzyme
MKPLDELDGKIGEGFGGYSPNGAHLNVVLAKRGSPTAAAAISMFAHPSPGHVPVLVVTGATQQDYEPVFPPTLMMNKATALEEHHQTMTWGAAQLGIAQAVLDAVDERLLEPTQELLVLVAVWVEAAADDETALRKAAREGMLKAIRVAVEGRDPDRVRAQIAGRDSLRSPFYGGA